MILTQFGHAVLNDKGYPRLTSGPLRHRYVHRASFETVAGRAIKEGHTIHHMSAKTCWCPHNLVELQNCLHPAPEPPRHPYTGRFLTRGERRDWE